MSEIFINRARACAVTGHRVMEKTFKITPLKNIFYNLIEKGFDTFLIGMALGFDTLCFKVLEKIREEKNIKIIACVPCKSQSDKFTFKQKAEYDRMLSVADAVFYVSVEYDENCMQRRNMFMVDNSSALISYKRRDFGGTANTVNYALKKQVPIIEV